MTRQRGLGFVISLFLMTSAGFAAPPRVIKTTPANNARDVSPDTKEIRITFDQRMDTDHGYSIVGGGPTFPQVIGQPVWVDNKNLLLHVRLVASHTYWLSVNSNTFTNCVGFNGEPATPYPISFRTKGAPGAAAKPAAQLNPEQNRKAISVLRKAIDQDYSYRDLRKVNWDQQFFQFDAQLQSAPTAAEFAQVVSKLLEPADDLHISIHAGEETFYAWDGTVPPENVNGKLLPRIVPKWTQHGNIVATGQYPDGPAYIFVKLWDTDREADLEAAYQVLSSADPAHGLIIDVRPNGGGDEPMAQRFAGCFIDAPHVYGKNDIRRGGKFLGPYDRAVEPNVQKPHFHGKVAVLMGPRSVSSNESFLLMMKAGGGKLIGSRSRGASGNPKPADLGNGVIVYLSSWRDMLPNGVCFEGVGIAPDIDVPTKPEDFSETDPVLDAAVKYLKWAK